MRDMSQPRLLVTPEEPMSRSLWSMHSAVLALCCVGGRAAAADAPLTVHFSRCTEFVGIVPADAAAARALVPMRYALMTDAAGARLVVRLTDCEAVRVGHLPSRPGRLAQIGLLNLVGKLLPSNRIGSSPVSYRGAYDAATMLVDTAP